MRLQIQAENGEEESVWYWNITQIPTHNSSEEEIVSVSYKVECENDLDINLKQGDTVNLTFFVDGVIADYTAEISYVTDSTIVARTESIDIKDN